MRLIGPNEIKVPPGKYYISDPGYAGIFKDDSAWTEFLRIREETPSALVEFRGAQIISFDTAHGDGLFEDQNRHRYGVDTAMLGLLPEIFRPRVNTRKRIYHGFDFQGPFICSNDGGLMCFGSVTIDTR